MKSAESHVSENRLWSAMVFFEVVQVFHYTDVDPNEKRVAIIRVR